MRGPVGTDRASASRRGSAARTVRFEPGSAPDPNFPSTSCPVSTASTPSIALASETSTSRIRACGYGERTISAHAAPGPARSSVKAAPTGEKRWSSLRATRRPIQPLLMVRSPESARTCRGRSILTTPAGGRPFEAGGESVLPAAPLAPSRSSATAQGAVGGSTAYVPRPAVVFAIGDATAGSCWHDRLAVQDPGAGMFGIEGRRTVPPRMRQPNELPTMMECIREHATAVTA